MSPTTGLLLIQQIQPLITAAIGRGAVRTVGSEDKEEIIQDTLASAAALLDSAEAGEKTYTAGTIAFYALQAAKSGRRSTVKGRTDALCPGAALDGKAQTVSLDQPVTAATNPDESELTFHDCLAANMDSPDQEAGRRIDWDIVFPSLNTRETLVLRDAATGIKPSETATGQKVSRPRVTQLRRQIGARVANAWGTDDPIAGIAERPAWVRHVSVARECRASRYERQQQS